MATEHASPGEVIDVLAPCPAATGGRTHVLFKTKNLEVIRMVMQAGKEITQHRAPGEITVQCLEGKIAFTALGKTVELAPGELLLLPPAEPHSVKCVEDSSFLLTILLHS
jgi:quercetin dioxygenase-like cupin family protein